MNPVREPIALTPFGQALVYNMIPSFAGLTKDALIGAWHSLKRQNLRCEVLYCEHTRNLVSVLKCAETIKEKKIVQYTMFTRVVQLVEKVISGTMEVNSGLAGKIGLFDAYVKEELASTEYILKGTIKNMGQIDQAVKAVIAEHEGYIQGLFPDLVEAEERQAKIKQEVIEKIKNLYCFCGKMYVMLSDDQMKDKGERLYQRYQEAYENTSLLCDALLHPSSAE